MKRTFLAAVATISLATGAAFAQTDATEDPGAAGSGIGPSGANVELMAPFFTDDTMTVVRPVEENEATFMAMADADRQLLRDECDIIATAQTDTGREEANTTTETPSEEMTASIDIEAYPDAVADLCEQISGWE